MKRADLFNKREFVVRFILKYARRVRGSVTTEVAIKEALIAWDLINKEAPQCETTDNSFHCRVP